MKKSLIEKVGDTLPGIKLQAGETFAWSSGNKLITYRSDLLDKPDGQWALLHEAGHAKNDHKNYKSDFELLELEVEAWDYAKKLANKFSIGIDEEHIQNCLDTYRDWLHRRSSCPNCGVVCLQVSSTHYSCHNCHTSWTVTASRFCRPYRLLTNSSKSKRPLPKITTFS
jgi:hypothetical protein